MKAYMQLISDSTKYLNAGDYENFNLIPLPEGFEWIHGEPPADAVPYVELGPMEQVDAIISQAQAAMAEYPLPEDIQKQIYDLEPFIQTYYKRGANQLILDTINGFIIPEDDDRVTEGQRVQVDDFKAKLLAVFGA